MFVIVTFRDVVYNFFSVVHVFSNCFVCSRKIHRGSKLAKDRPPSISPDNQHYQVPNVPSEYLVPVASHEYNYIVPQPNDMSPDEGDFSEPEDDYDGSISCK